MAEPWKPPKAERVGLGGFALVETPEWEAWMQRCRDALKIAPRCWSAYLLGWQLRRLYEAGAILPAAQGAVVVLPGQTACTSVSARWCPIHGTCSCPEATRDMDDPTCPLHSHRSEHAAVAEGVS